MKPTSWFYVMNRNKIPFDWCCKQCRNEWRKQDRLNNIERYNIIQKKSKEKNKDKIKLKAKEYYEKNRDYYIEWHSNYSKNNRNKMNAETKRLRKDKWYNPIHIKTWRKIKQLWIRPTICPICWKERRIFAHHPDYSKWYEIVFCCNWCHIDIHNWNIICPNPINLLEQ